MPSIRHAVAADVLGLVRSRTPFTGEVRGELFVGVCTQPPYRRRGCSRAIVEQPLARCREHAAGARGGR
jgi:hypothetical protein